MLEAPGWVLAAFIAMALHRWVDLSVVTGSLFVAAWIVKDLVLYPWLRDAYAGDGQSPKEALVGRTAVVVEPLQPVGIVRVGAELWRAESVAAEVPVSRGQRVRVEGVEGLTLRVTETGGPSRTVGSPAPSGATGGRGCR